MPSAEDFRSGGDSCRHQVGCIDKDQPTETAMRQFALLDAPTDRLVAYAH